MTHITRKQDITPILDETFRIRVDETEVDAVPGESVLSTLLANEFRRIMKNDYGQSSGAFCGMGVCHCCMVSINGRHKKRACQTIVQPGMEVSTCRNRVVEGADQNV
ncbi:(2Fe-2S)-binding protein [Photobacterium sp. GJ3]|uniref:(2Fe-2S)-binding protein n=1 Tax=Photobacterium sp. GJ3 TaxID=2829502 RepID=UPI001B8A9805|nr:(2Fe-2S)-binding protein [Photobacterium sp. GJ3]QUJ66302.1 (2Fe-2S)-binding protein [Photobacterium sp. GJ3]